MTWKNILLLFIIAFCAELLCGCVSLPKFRTPTSPPAPGLTLPAAGTFHPSQAVPSASSVAETAHAEAILFWIIGILLVLGGGALLYFQFYLAGAKVIIAGIALPVLGSIWSAHYAIIITASLVGLAIWYILTHQAAVSAIAKTIGKDAGAVLQEIKGVASIAASKAAPVTVSTATQNSANVAKV
jgi:hypothetical protein